MPRPQPDSEWGATRNSRVDYIAQISQFCGNLTQNLNYLRQIIILLWYQNKSSLNLNSIPTLLTPIFYFFFKNYLTRCPHTAHNFPLNIRNF